MKRFSIVCLTFCIACTSNEKEKKNDRVRSDTSSINQTERFSLNEQPAKTIIDFLKWYRANENKLGIDLVKNAGNEMPDSSKYYSVNFEATEKYLSDLKATGFISDQYIAKWRAYFKKCDKVFKDNPSNEGPPDGFDYDLVMLSQEYDENLANLEKSTIVSQSVLADNAAVTIHFPNGDVLVYKHTKHGDKWLIDNIERA